MGSKLSRGVAVRAFAVFLLLAVGRAAALNTDYYILDESSTDPALRDPLIEVTVRDLGRTSTPNGEPFHYHFEFFHGGFWEGSTPHHEATIEGPGTVQFRPLSVEGLHLGRGVHTVDVRVTEVETGDINWLKLWYKLRVVGATTGGSPAPSIAFYAAAPNARYAECTYSLVDVDTRGAEEIKVHILDPEYAEMAVADGGRETPQLHERQVPVTIARGGRYTMVLTGVDKHGHDPDSRLYRDRRNHMMLPVVASDFIWEAHMYRFEDHLAADVGGTWPEYLGCYPNESFCICRPEPVAGASAILDEVEKGPVRVLYMVGHGNGGYSIANGSDGIYARNQNASTQQIYGRDFDRVKYVYWRGCHTALTDPAWSNLCTESVNAGADAASGFLTEIEGPGGAPPYWTGAAFWSNEFWRRMAGREEQPPVYWSSNDAAEAATDALTNSGYGRPRGYDSFTTFAADGNSGYVLGPAR